ncbi:MAG: Trm112 family protein [Acidimicrobiia bacterium]
MDNGVSNDLLDILVCPIDHKELLYFENEQILYNPRLKKKYEIVNSIPVLLIEKAIDVDEASHKDLINKKDL